MTLKLLTYALSRGRGCCTVPPPLPEALGADRNWDYRYCWLRDAALTMRAFSGLGISTRRSLLRLDAPRDAPHLARATGAVRRYGRTGSEKGAQSLA